MTTRFHHRRAVPARGLLKSIAAAALLASTLMAATSAQAGLVVFGAERLVEAKNSGSQKSFIRSFSSSGVFDEVARSGASQNDGGGPFSEAGLVSNIEPLRFSGTSISTAENNGKVDLLTRVHMSFDFTVSGDYSFSGFADLGVSDVISGAAEFFLARVVNGGDLEAILPLDDLDPLMLFSGTLNTGTYRLQATSDSVSFSPDIESVQTSFNFSITFSEVLAPPADVPEPHSLALALAGVLACGAVRRRQPRGAVAAR